MEKLRGMKAKVLIFIALVILLTSSAPEDPLNRLITNLDTYFKDFPQEKVYLQLDRQVYTSGETIHFNAFVLAGVQNLPSPLSKNLYVELLDDEQKIIEELLLYVKEGETEGSFTLPLNLQTGNYSIRAYTRWMLNAPHEFIFYQNIQILSVFENTPASVSGEEPEGGNNLKFFPEGGNLVKGQPTRIALKFVGKDGRGKEVEGQIFEESGALVTGFSTNLLGFGLVNFSPESDNYFAKINGEEEKYYLPKIFSEGLVFNTINNPYESDIKIRISITEGMGKEYIVLTHSRGALYNLQKVSILENSAILRIPKTDAVQGVTHITVFDLEMKPLAERLVYLDKGDFLRFQIKGIKGQYEKREKVDAYFNVSDNAGNPVKGSFTASVFSENSIIPGSSSRNFYTYSQLESELLGEIEDPLYYFDENNEDRHQALDLLLMTQGWRRFKWEDMLENVPVGNHFIETGILLEGTLVNDLNKKPIEGGRILYFSQDSEDGFVQTVSGINGRFSISDLVFYENSEINLQGENKKGKKFTEIHLDSVKKVYPTPFIRYPLHVVEYGKEQYSRFLRDSQSKLKNDALYNLDSETIDLGEFTVKSTREQIEEQIERMYGKGDVQFVPSEWQGTETAGTIFEMMQGRMAGIMIRPDGSGGFMVTIRGNASLQGNTSPLFLINNIPVSQDVVATINPRDVELIEVYKGPSAAIFGSAGGAGAIAIYLKKGSNMSNTVKGLQNYSVRGFHRHKEFYSPDYSNSETEMPHDSRPTIFWKTKILTDENGNAKISFYHSDNPGTFYIRLEGITPEGKIGSVIQEIYQSN
jgi:hypothetical protein